MVQFSAQDLKLLAPAARAYAFLALVLSNGEPQVTPVWFEWDGTHIIINTARGRVKDKVLQKHPTVALCITADEPLKYVQIRGKVVHETEEGGYEKICDLREKYEGDRNFPKRPGQVRVTYKILPLKVDSHH